MPTTKNDQRTREIILQAIQEVIIPVLDEMPTKEDLKRVESGLNNRIDNVETRMEQMDRKLDIITAKAFAHDGKFVDHEQRIKNLENRSPISQ